MRDEVNLQNLRPKIQTETTEDHTLEHFQNEVLRPILKFQHELFKAEVMNNPSLNKILTSNFPDEIKRDQLKSFLQKSELRFQFLGQISGLFTINEFNFYNKRKKDLDKRIVSMLIDRLLSMQI
ncbi:MAG: hypothetical protein RL264_2639 [Bacteroidota bacterium]|jgi:hypothetical protein